MNNDEFILQPFIHLSPLLSLLFPFLFSLPACAVYTHVQRIFSDILNVHTPPDLSPALSLLLAIIFCLRKIGVMKIIACH